MKSKVKNHIRNLILVLPTVFCSGAFAAEGFIYPELQVSPRATERVAMEAKSEKSAKWSTHIPVQVSALATMVAGFYASSNKPPEDKVKPDDAKWANTTAIGIGAAWLVGTYFLTENYTPYQTAMTVTQGLPGKTQQEILTRERIAEEHIESAGRIGTRLMWASTISNFAAAAYLGGNASREGSIMAGVAGLLAFTPLVFRYNWQNVSHYHNEYKKKIYGPITMPTVFQSSVARNEAIPGFTWLMSF